MRDPITFTIPALQAWVEPICEYLHLRTLPLHIHEILGAALIYHTIFEYLAAPISNLLFSSSYTKLPYDSKMRWNMNCTSVIQSVAISLLTLYTIAADKERQNMTLEERIWGYTGAAGLVQALACGYFLFDFLAMVRYYKVFGPAMLIHGASCFITYVIGFRPICNYYGCVFMVFELSTPFLNIHWFFDKLGMTGTKAQLYNGLMLLTMFFFARLVWGAFATVYIYRDIWHAINFSSQPVMQSSEEIMKYGNDRSLPNWLVASYLLGHITLNSLNVYWFTKMIDAVKKRFVKRDGVKQHETKTQEKKSI